MSWSNKKTKKSCFASRLVEHWRPYYQVIVFIEDEKSSD